ncbi:HK97 gp10 family phage protein [Leclercia sp.]|uniref:HK97 gp10 family phage protein n=1 Tax=Leclercia sp. TaxID=1898428 RepID=UPI0028AEA630|nr:HK97 gp10 family phage protein [Leclercia sp.]
MGAKLIGVKQAQAKLDAIVGEIQSRNVVAAITAASIIISTEAASMTPVATSTLINSQYRAIDINGTRVTGKIGYSASYALYVHNAPGKLLGKGVARTGKLKGKGNVWDKTGEPKFLSKAVENTKELVDNAIRREMKL